MMAQSLRGRLAILFAGVATACGAAATGNDTAQSAQPEAQNRIDAAGGGTVPTAAAPDLWAGHYDGGSDGGSLIVKIDKAGTAGRYVVNIETIGERGCSGEIKGTGTASGDRLTLSERLPESGEICRMDLSRSGSTLRVSEGENCYQFHGMSCGFSGTATKRGAAASSAPAASRPTSSWLVGAWIYEGGYCASGEPIIFRAGGGYANSGGDIDGRWSLSGNMLAVRFREVDPTTGEASGAEDRQSAALEHLGANEMRFGRDRFRRCPTADGVEPWHPDTAFDTD